MSEEFGFKRVGFILRSAVAAQQALNITVRLRVWVSFIPVNFPSIGSILPCSLPLPLPIRPWSLCLSTSLSLCRSFRDSCMLLQFSVISCLITSKVANILACLARRFRRPHMGCACFVIRTPSNTALCVHPATLQKSDGTHL